jgi:hypothetical protein
MMFVSTHIVRKSSADILVNEFEIYYRCIVAFGDKEIHTYI